jgi:hypothetical protein
MVTVGVDSHKRTHTLVEVADVGKKLAERTLAGRRRVILTPWPERSGGRSRTAVI